MFNFSCNKDSLAEKVDLEAEEPIKTPDYSGTVVFEEGFIMHKDKRFINFVLPEADYDNFLKGEGDIKVISNKVYTYLKDEFDFIFILSIEEQQPSGVAYGLSYKLKNDVAGIGAEKYDNTSSYGSEGKLKSIIYMPRTEYILNGPFLHEIAHYWGNRGFIPSTVNGHWGYSSVGGQLGGFDELIDLGNNTYQGKFNGVSSFGTFANGGNSLPYSTIELYVMGLLNAEDLTDVQVAENPQDILGNGKFSADRIITLTAENLIVENGIRVPSAQDSQKSFNAITIVISKAAVSNEKSIALNLNLDNFSKNAAPDAYWGNSLNFWQATKERASINVVVAIDNIK